jgi:hypothetical protein
MAGFGAARSAAYDAVSRQQQRQLFQGMSAHDRHRKMVHDLVAYYGGQLPREGQVRGEGRPHHAATRCSCFSLSPSAAARGGRAPVLESWVA